MKNMKKSFSFIELCIIRGSIIFITWQEDKNGGEVGQGGGIPRGIESGGE